jgi:hypothetical protein
LKRRTSPVLAELETSGAIKIAGAMYNLKTGAVQFFDQPADWASWTLNVRFGLQIQPVCTRPKWAFNIHVQAGPPSRSNATFVRRHERGTNSDFSLHHLIA